MNNGPKQVVAEIEGNGGSASLRLTTLGDLESARELVEWATEARRRSRRHPHQQRWRRLARTEQRSHRSGVRRDLCTERQGSVLPRRVPGTSHGRTRMGFDRQRQHHGRQLRTGRHGYVRRQPSGSRTLDEGLGRRIRRTWCSGQRRCARPDAHPDDGSGCPTRW